MIENDSIKGHARPIDYREIGSLLDRLAQSRLMLFNLRSELDKIITNNPTIAHRNASVCVFGSIARGEFDFKHSDIDILFVGFNQTSRNLILKGLTEDNGCFNFKDLAQHLASTNEKAAAKINLRFPCITEDLLLAKAEAPQRHMQFLLESVPLSGCDTHKVLIAKMIGNYRLVPTPKIRQTPQAFMKQLELFYDLMHEEIKAKDGKQSDYFAKYIIVRELGQHLSRLSLVQATLSRQHVRNAENPAFEFARILRQPALAKLLFWSSQQFLSGNIMSSLKEKHYELLLRKIRIALKNAGLEDLSEESQLCVDDMISLVVINAAKAFSNTLDLLHSPELRASLASKQPNIVNWRSDPDLKYIDGQVRYTIRWLHGLAEIISCILPLAENVGAARKLYRHSGLEIVVNHFHHKISNDPYVKGESAHTAV